MPSSRDRHSRHRDRGSGGKRERRSPLLEPEHRAAERANGRDGREHRETHLNRGAHAVVVLHVHEGAAVMCGGEAAKHEDGRYER